MCDNQLRNVEIQERRFQADQELSLGQSFVFISPRMLVIAITCILLVSTVDSASK